MMIVGAIILTVSQIINYGVTMWSAFILILVGIVIRGEIDFFLKRIELKRLHKEIDKLSKNEAKEEEGCSGCSNFQ